MFYQGSSSLIRHTQLHYWPNYLFLSCISQQVKGQMELNQCSQKVICVPLKLIVSNSLPYRQTHMDILSISKYFLFLGLCTVFAHLTPSVHMAQWFMLQLEVMSCYWCSWYKQCAICSLQLFAIINVHRVRCPVINVTHIHKEIPH